MTRTAAGRAIPRALDRLAVPREGSTISTIDWQTPIDRTRWFFCETLTPLYYTPVYQHLEPHHRRRYNQLTAMLATEVILLLETEFLDASLRTVASRRNQAADLFDAVSRFKDDERRHADAWRRLNRLSERRWYEAADGHLVCLPRPACMLARYVARHPDLFPVVFWVQLVQEERSIEFSRRCLRVAADLMEPRYRAVYADHLRDEVQHVQIDRHLIERFYRPRSRAVRRMTAWLLTTLIRTLLLTPVRSTARVVRILASEHPELAPLVPRILGELAALGGNLAYHDMMYSRRTTPITFGLFDRFEEFHRIGRVLLAYRPEPAGRLQ